MIEQKIMETSKMETTDIRQVERLLRAHVENIAETSERIRLITLVSDYASLLERTQSLPILQRLNFFECTYIVFSFLRLNGQLRRSVERFDETCADDLHQMIKRLYEGL